MSDNDKEQQYREEERYQAGITGLLLLGVTEDTSLQVVWQWQADYTRVYCVAWLEGDERFEPEDITEEVADITGLETEVYADRTWIKLQLGRNPNELLVEVKQQVWGTRPDSAAAAAVPVDDFDTFLQKQKQPLKFYGVDNLYFKLDDRVFRAVENESDGLRSMLQAIEVTDPAEAKNLVFFREPVAEVIVENLVNYTHENDYDTFDGYRLVDANDQHVWLEIGTSAYDEWYPTFIFSYTPKTEPVTGNNTETVNE